MKKNTFKIFLGKNVFVDHSDCLGNPQNSEAVYVRDLGEWAWDKLLPLIVNVEAISSIGAKWAWADEGVYLYEIAQACLGEEEIDKRFKRLKR